MSNFYEGETVNISGSITFNGSAPDISSDIVTLMVKKNRDDVDSDAKIDVDADVTTDGANGNYYIDMPPATTTVTPGAYFYEILWFTSGGAKYVLESGSLIIIDRIIDT